jgi:hypothetical protein
MTEAEWHECDDPDRIMAYLEECASERKLCLLCGACCRRVWHLLETESLRQAVDIFERFADGEIDDETFRVAGSTTHPLSNYRDEMFSGQLREQVMWAAYALNAAMFARPGYGYRKAMEFLGYAAHPGENQDRAVQIELIREVFGNPFRPAEVQPVWLSWCDSIIVKLAADIYDERSLPAGILDGLRLQILADALEEAGCNDETLLAHCRKPGEHVRGCWVVDLLLGKAAFPCGG